MEENSWLKDCRFDRWNEPMGPEQIRIDPRGRFWLSDQGRTWATVGGTTTFSLLALLVPATGRTPFVTTETVARANGAIFADFAITFIFF